MTKFGAMSKKSNMNHALSKVTNQLLHEQMQRSMLQTAMSAHRANSASPDRSPGPRNNNYVGAHLLDPSASHLHGSEGSADQEFRTFQEQHSPIHRAAQERGASQASGGRNNAASPHVGLDDLVRASASRL